MHNSALRVLAHALVLFFAVAACSRGSHSDESSTSTGASPGTQPSASVFPAGVLPPAQGLYPADGAGQCCFLSGHATLTLQSVPGSERVAFKFYVPDVAPLRGGAEHVTVALDGIAAGTSGPLPPGERDVTLEIPAALRQKKSVVASLTMSRTWVPRNIGLNADERELSIMLLQVSYI
jgi:hypothetical protein